MHAREKGFAQRSGDLVCSNLALAPKPGQTSPDPRAPESGLVLLRGPEKTTREGVRLPSTMPPRLPEQAGCPTRA
jgi:hypothetical protein